VHFPFAATDVPQVLVWAKSPVTVTLVIDNAVLRLFVRVATLGLLVVPRVRLANVSVAGDNPTATIPVPLVLIVCGLLVALSVMVTVPVAAPTTVGVNITAIMQVFPAATELAQVLLCVKLPLAPMLVIDNFAVPVFVSVTFLTALVVPTTSLPKLKVVAESETVCAVATLASKRSINPHNKNAVRRLLEKRCRTGTSAARKVDPATSAVILTVWSFANMRRPL
jgi:hypothetical protein